MVPRVQKDIPADTTRVANFDPRWRHSSLDRSQGGATSDAGVSKGAHRQAEERTGAFPARLAGDPHHSVPRGMSAPSTAWRARAERGGCLREALAERTDKLHHEAVHGSVGQQLGR
eukprot:1176900-Rhodomonas_salina.6